MLDTNFLAIDTMFIAAKPVAKPAPMEVKIDRGDVRTIQGDRTWADFEHLEQGFGDTHRVRLFYYAGTIEILMPGEAHELFKSVIGFLIEMFLFSRKIEFKPTGSMTQRLEKIVSLEADESYVIQGFKLSIEINFTSGSTSKLAPYHRLGVDEVWIWEDGLLRVYHRQSNGDESGYEEVSHSLIPALAPIDLTVLSDCILIGETARIKAAEALLAAHPIID